MSGRRLFFALWLDEAAAQAAHRLAVECSRQRGGRVMRADSLHLTLAFLGQVAETRLPALLAIGQSAAAGSAGFSLHFDILGHWPHNRIVWASCRNTPDALLALAGDLRQRLGELGLGTDARPFFPHLTLLRNVLTAPASGELAPPVVLPATRLQLVESLPQSAGGYRYQTLAEWPLGA